MDPAGNILEGKYLADSLVVYYPTNGENLAKAFVTGDLPFNKLKMMLDLCFVSSH